MKYQHKHHTTRLTIVIWLASLLLNGCGGSEQGTDSLSNDVEAANQLDINQLIAPDDFSFTTKSTVEVEIDLEQYRDQRAYLNIYRSFQLLDSGQYYPEPASRILAGALNDGKVAHSFVGLQQQQQYLIEIWRYDGQLPQQKLVVLQDNRLDWTTSINQ